jgi:nicotinamide-nucleotide amidase
VDIEPELYELAVRTGRRLHAAGRRLVTAESCTAGWIAKALTDVPGSSQWFECGYVTYSNAAKMRDLGVTARTLADFGAVSEQAVREMAAGALRVSGASVAVAVSGIAGPDGGTPDKPVGTVWLCAAARERDTTEVIAEGRHFDGDRARVRGRSVEEALRLLLRLSLARHTDARPRPGPA